MNARAEEPLNASFTEPRLTHVADLFVDVAAPIVIGETAAGLRRIVPITGGHVIGRIEGRIEAGGADFQILRTDGVTELEARYTILTPSGARIYVVNRGIRTGPKHVMDALARGETVDPKDIYFRATPSFETGDPEYKWLMQRLFVTTGVRRPDRVELRLYEC